MVCHLVIRELKPGEVPHVIDNHGDYSVVLHFHDVFLLVSRLYSYLSLDHGSLYATWRMTIDGKVKASMRTESGQYVVSLQTKYFKYEHRRRVSEGSISPVDKDVVEVDFEEFPIQM